MTNNVSEICVDCCLDETCEYCDWVEGAFCKVSDILACIYISPILRPLPPSPRDYIMGPPMEARPLARLHCLTASDLKLDSPVHPIRDIQSPVKSQSSEIMSGNRFRLSSSLEHE